MEEVMKQVEITTRVLETLNSITQKLAKQGFQIIRKSRVEDEYLTQYQGDFEQKHILEMLSSSVLLRYLDVNGKITKKITYKQKTYQNEIVMTEEKINVNCDDLDMAKKLFLALHFRPLVKVCYDVIVFSNQKIELAFQNVENLGLLVEYESEKDFSDSTEEEILLEKQQMLKEIKNLNIQTTEEIDVKKAYELIQK
jgi:predicted adenylyl cyclase CyaB